MNDHGLDFNDSGYPVAGHAQLHVLWYQQAGLKDFETFEGYEVKLETADMIDGRRRFRGELAGVEGDEVLINVEEGTIGLEFDWLSEAKLILTDDLIKEMLRQRKASGDINQDDFDEIVTEQSEEE